MLTCRAYATYKVTAKVRVHRGNSTWEDFARNMVTGMFATLELDTAWRCPVISKLSGGILSVMRSTYRYVNPRMNANFQ